MMRLFMTAIVAASSLLAQPTRFGAETRVVTVPVNVTNENGQPAENLDEQAFRLVDNGRRRSISVDTVDTGIAPIAIAIVVQSSSLSAPALEKVKRAVGMIHPIITGERGCAMLLSFAERVEMLQECTSQEAVFRKTMSKLDPAAHREARMLDGVREAIKQLSRLDTARRVVLVISESKDRGSDSSTEAVIAEAVVQGVAVYAADYSALRTGFTREPAPSQPKRSRERPSSDTIPGRDQVPAPVERNVNMLSGLHEVVRLRAANTTRALVDATGGLHFSFTTTNGLEGILQQIGEDLNTQYLLSFMSQDSAPGYHKLEVRVNRPGVTVRARPGYWSASR
jgi:VWFA-related protein